MEQLLRGSFTPNRNLKFAKGGTGRAESNDEMSEKPKPPHQLAGLDFFQDQGDEEDRP